MQRSFWLSIFSVFLILSTAIRVNAAEIHSLEQMSFSDLRQQLQLPFNQQLKTKQSLDGLRLLHQRTDQGRMNHFRMQQQYAGIDVYGGYAILHSKMKPAQLLTTFSNVAMNGKIYTQLESELGQPKAEFLKNAPLVLEQFKRNYQDYNLSDEQIQPIVYIDELQHAHWAYKLSVYVHYKHQVPEIPTAIVDAKTEEVLRQWNDIKTSSRLPVKGQGYGGNSKIGEYSFGKKYPLLDIGYSLNEKHCYLENSIVRVVDMQHEYNGVHETMNFNCKKSKENALSFWTGYFSDGYDAFNGAFSPSNDALYFGQVIKNLYEDWYHIPVLTKNGKPMPLIMRVHYGEDYDNAFWDGKQMTFGDGDSMVYPLVSLGIGAHEVSHGFTDQHSDLAYYDHSGGINESFSDMAAQAAEYYLSGKNSWLLGAEVLKEETDMKSFRYMNQPSLDGNSIDSADQYFDGLDVHYSSGVFNRLFYLISNSTGWNTRKAFDVMVKANMDYWTPNTNFEEAGCGVLNAAHDLGYSLTAIKNSLTEVALSSDSCKLVSS